MATRKSKNISGNYAALHILNALFIYVLRIYKKIKDRTKSYFTFFLKLNDHQTRCFNFGLSRIHPNDCMLELNFQKFKSKTKPF